MQKAIVFGNSIVVTISHRGYWRARETISFAFRLFNNGRLALITFKEIVGQTSIKVPSKSKRRTFRYTFFVCIINVLGGPVLSKIK